MAHQIRPFVKPYQTIVDTLRSFELRCRTRAHPRPGLLARPHGCEPSEHHDGSDDACNRQQRGSEYQIGFHTLFPRDRPSPPSRANLYFVIDAGMRVVDSWFDSAQKNKRVRNKVIE